METAESAANAKAVKGYVEGRRQGITAEYDYKDKALTFSGSGIESRRVPQRDWCYLYRLKDADGSVEVPVTRDAIIQADATAVGGLLLEAFDGLRAAGKRTGAWVELVAGVPNLSWS